MFNKSQDITKRDNSLKLYIEDTDIYNSLLLYKLNDSKLNRISYIIPDNYQYRPDLIAKDLYESEGLQGYVMLQTGLQLNQYVGGTKLKLLSHESLKKLINGI